MQSTLHAVEPAPQYDPSQASFSYAYDLCSEAIPEILAMCRLSLKAMEDPDSVADLADYASVFSLIQYRAESLLAAVETEAMEKGIEPGDKAALRRADARVAAFKKGMQS